KTKEKKRVLEKFTSEGWRGRERRGEERRGEVGRVGGDGRGEERRGVGRAWEVGRGGGRGGGGGGGEGVRVGGVSARGNGHAPQHNRAERERGGLEPKT